MNAHSRHPAGLPVVSTTATQRTRDGKHEDAATAVADEAPVALVFNGITHAVMMASPTDLEDFALGFALSEGIVDSRADWRGADVETHPHGLEVHAEIASHCFVRLKERRRALAGPTGCGLCGIESLQTFEIAPVPLVPPAWVEALPDAQVLDALKAMTAHQPANALTGGLHAAGWVPAGGSAPLHVLEDVGRHNALDKLIGHLARLDIRPADGFIVMTSRASYELVRKCVHVGVPLLATISAPSSLAISHANAGHLTLLAFCRGDSVTRFA
ncbi:formate dehydrogenase accessory sulfurtransferase FdhD [uncultured Ralstonia sp.]|jgi:FdhD protein|uniref:formate dehydrogenase accessory sulfurtransferase FdhD n=1 Tax=Ralstonia sp. TaxID=54061 RepID=UPI001EA444EE|nr:formate dehydrogenase accessory sulfurtransferase FdhD [uncultured Ralstonia sp.]UCF24694.1 MAG: formate dehydrogenase accessory sulfurtransferase FdhD [Ralstonia sp.]